MKRSVLLFFLMAVFGSSLFGQALAGKKFCIDPGHGGHNEANDRHVIPDVGNDFWESESNLSKGVQLKALLEAQGAWVILTRYTNDYPADDEPTLTARWQLANANNVDWFHSIHSNATGWTSNTTVNYTLLLVKEDKTTRVAVWPTAVTMSNLMGPKIQAKIRDQNRTTWTYLDYTFYGGPPNGYNLGVLSGTAMPAELSEGSFHDFFPETRRLKNTAYHKMEMYALRDAFMQFFGASADTMSIVAGIITNVASGLPINQCRVRVLPEDYVYNGDVFKNGFYMIDGLKAGVKKVIFESPGYMKDSVTVTVGVGATLFIDRTSEAIAAPAVLASSPVQNDPAFPAHKSIVLQFTRTMDTAATRQAFSITPAVKGAFSWDASRTAITFKPDTVLPIGMTFTVKVDSGARSVDGLVLDANSDGVSGDPYLLTFTTVYVDVYPPAILSRTPAVEDTLQSPNAIMNFTFNEHLNPATLTIANIVVQEVGGSVMPRTFAYHEGGMRSGANVFFQTWLKPGKTYKMRISGIGDELGNLIPSTGAPITQYYVSPQQYQFTVIDSLDNVAAGWAQPEADTHSKGLSAGKNAFRAVAPGMPATVMLPNTGAAELAYAWDTTATDWLLCARYTGTLPQFTAVNNKLQVYLLGDGSGTLFRFTVQDQLLNLPPAASYEAGKWISIDWVGWRLVEWDFDKDGAVNWLGNGMLDNSMQLDGFQLKYVKGSSFVSGAIRLDHVQLATKVQTGVERNTEVIPAAFALKQNYPNPFNPETRIGFDVPSTSDVVIAISDMLGRHVRTLVSGTYAAGSYTSVWNGRDDAGRSLASGTYFYAIRAGNYMAAKKMVLLK